MARSQPEVSTLDAEALLSALFRAAPPTHKFEIRRVDPHMSWIVDPEAISLPDEADMAVGNWFFSAAPRGPRGVVDLVTAIWCDIDTPEFPGPAEVFPPPTAMVTSGKGVHIYWALDEPLQADVGRGLLRLARLAYGGDPACAEVRRVMRLPGTNNFKYKPPRPAELLHIGRASYGEEALREALVAQVMIPLWEGGGRHQLALGLSALLRRAKWPQPRVEATIRVVAQAAHDEELGDRLNAVATTFARAETNKAVSSGPVWDALDKGYADLLAGLGLDVQVGDLLLNGNPLGPSDDIEALLVDAVIETGEWAYGEGIIQRWYVDHWRPSSEAELRSGCFTLLRGVTIDANGVEARLPAKRALADSVSTIVKGSLESNPMEGLDPGVLPLKNGLLVVRSRALHEHGPENRNRWVIPTEYDPEATCPTWLRFMAEALPGLESYLQEWAGYLLIPGNPFQRMLWLYGRSGTGKSTVLKALTGILGDQAVAPVDFTRLGEYDVASLAEKAVAEAAEMSKRVLRTSTIKSLVTGDPLQARFPHGRPFKVRFGGKILLASNGLPPVDEGEGLWRRIVVLPMDVVPAVVDPLLEVKLRAEASGILNWALQGADRVLRMQDEALAWELPEVALAIVREYQEAADTFGLFAEARLEMDPRAVVRGDDIYGQYIVWAKEQGLSPEGYGPGFYQGLKRLGLNRATKMVNGKTTKVWVGARVATTSFNTMVDDNDGV